MGALAGGVAAEVGRRAATALVTRGAEEAVAEGVRRGSAATAAIAPWTMRVATQFARQ